MSDARFTPRVILQIGLCAAVTFTDWSCLSIEGIFTDEPDAPARIGCSTLLTSPDATTCGPSSVTSMRVASTAICSSTRCGTGVAGSCPVNWRVPARTA